ncbi:hypothetical protein [Streptomyces lydicus]|uniref:hypothetical protein n=1 Tax=Streptomyces lydicus TaxID=47763 RepID=UPI0010124DD8|nr:hypothetical protein [Streptomyces lydicus]MCZ1012049.1 hypothetical protein [Streptomyces lydicus]
MEERTDMPSDPTAVDPYGCGCTECLTGEYIPLERATEVHIADMLAGRLRNHTGTTFHLTADYTIEPNTTLPELTPERLTITCPDHELTWTLATPRHRPLEDHHRAGPSLEYSDGSARVVPRHRLPS